MFGDGGIAYLYFTYGMHWCFNVVAGGEGDPGAVLVRALEPTDGAELMAERRGRGRDLTTGPARLCQALALDGSFDGHRLDAPPVWIERDDTVEPDRIEVTGRIGIRQAREWPLRFAVRAHPSLSTRRAPAARIMAVPAEIRPLVQAATHDGESE